MNSSASSGRTLEPALRIIRATPGYAHVAVELAQMAAENAIRLDPELEDRAQTGVMGLITLGPEAFEGTPLSLAQTLVHEHFHLHQNPWLKTLSFWSGVLRGEPPMKRYEQPAYRAAHDFLEAVKRASPKLAAEAGSEQNAIQQVFSINFGGPLL